MKHNITTYPDTQTWLDDAAGMGATTAYKLMNLCPSSWGGAWSVWARYHMEGWEQDKVGAAAGAGLTWEPHVLQWYDDARLEAGHTLDTSIARIEGTDEDLPLRPSPDGMVLVGDSMVGGVEVKCPAWGWDAYDRDGTVVEGWLPPGSLYSDDPTEMPQTKGWYGRRRDQYPAPLHYCVQVYTTMLAARRAGHDVEWWDLVVFFGPHNVRVIRFMWDDDVCGYLERVLVQLWDEVVTVGEEPPPDQTRGAWNYLLEKPRPKKPVELDPDLERELIARVVDYVEAHFTEKEALAVKSLEKPIILQEQVSRGTAGLLVAGERGGVKGTYSLKVTPTGRTYAKFIVAKTKKDS
tara:strand:+ start:1256 stop:2305 length:1050 start_codon:yes stop_codon:yes gene_type:complete